jgi:hypothetical protein
MAETLTTRVTRLEKGMIRVENALAHLAEIQRREIEESAARDKRMDERIEKLVSAIGAFIARVDKR